jgi:DNA polymerase-1
VKPLLESDAVLKVGQNIKYDLNVMARFRHRRGAHRRHDGHQLRHGRRAQRGRHRRRPRHGRAGAAPPWPHLHRFKEVCGTGKKQISFAEVALDRATQYAAEDAEVTWRLHRLLKPRLAAEGASGSMSALTVP